MSPPTFPVRFRDLVARIHYEDACPVDFAIGSTTIEPIRLSHPNSGSGYKFCENGRSFVFLTDNELGFIHPGGLEFDAYLDFCRGADLLIHDAEYTPDEYRTAREWGHSSYTDAVDLALAAGVRRLGLFHMQPGPHRRCVGRGGGGLPPSHRAGRQRPGMFRRGGGHDF